MNLLNILIILSSTPPEALPKSSGNGVLFTILALLLVPIALIILSNFTKKGHDENVFEERNQDFGAYTQRKSLVKLLSIAYLVGFIIFGGILWLLSQTSTKQEKKETPKTREIQINKKLPAKEKPKPKPKPKPKEEKPKETPKQEMQKFVEPLPKEDPDESKMFKVDTTKSDKALGSKNQEGAKKGGVDDPENTGGGAGGVKEPILTDNPTVLPEFAKGGEDGLVTAVTLACESELSGFDPGVHVIILDFIVELDGSVTGVKFAPGFEPIDMKLANIVKNKFKNIGKAGAFTAGEKEGEDVRVHMQQEFVFELE